MGAYYQYVSVLRPSINLTSGIGDYVWSEPYMDESGAGFVRSLSREALLSSLVSHIGFQCR